MPNQNFSLPRRLSRLPDLTYNLWGSWNPEAQMLFRRVDEVLWEQVRHNPVRFLHEVPRPRINAASQDPGYLKQYDDIMAEFDAYMQAKDTWYQKTFPDNGNQLIAYFSTEFGLHESLPMYAGGLGVLSGDHCKAASDLGLPFVGVGFLYEFGYFRQRVTEDGWQEATYDRLDLDQAPVTPVLQYGGKEARVSVELPDRVVHARLWRIQVGRVPLFLMDTDNEQNEWQDRQLTMRLYDSDLERRLSQEIVLGIGGVRALRTLGLRPTVWHMNEGHSAFLSLERLREYVSAGLSFEEGQEKVRASTVFTTHTPVPAGHDTFPHWMMEKYFYGYWEQLGLTREQFLDLARQDQPWGPTFGMTVLALKMSGRSNAVSELHGEVSRRMWQSLWPGTPIHQIPISSITNGVHTKSWLARRYKRLFDRYLGYNWEERLDDIETWDRIWDIPDADIWVVHMHLKRKLLHFIRERVRQQWQRGEIQASQVGAAGVLLDPNVLTIGFARRFATYKRAGLVFRDLERLKSILTNPHRPVQLIFAGKAHPADEPGKQVIQEVYRLVRNPALAGRLVFIEDYDLNVARHMVQGVDVWLNTPRRPQEASGTSGMKAGTNGVLNFSILDGWWGEGYNGQNGWVIGDDVTLDDPQEQDEHDADSLYTTLQSEIVPMYYEKGDDGQPHRWIHMMKESMRTIAPSFSTRRMVKEYTLQMYFPPKPVALEPETNGRVAQEEVEQSTPIVPEVKTS